MEGVSVAQIRKYFEHDTYTVLTYPVNAKIGQMAFHWRADSGPRLDAGWVRCSITYVRSCDNNQSCDDIVLDTC